MATAGQFDTNPIIARVKTLINANLKNVLKGAGLNVSGVKATMQERLIKHIHQLAQEGNLDGLNQMRVMVNSPETVHSPLAPRIFQNSPLQPASRNTYPVPIGSGMAAASFAPTVPAQTFGPARPHYKDSPFYSILEPLSPIVECKVRESTRDQVECKIALKPETAERLKRDAAIRAMVYCTAEPVSPFAKADIVFPHQIEIKVNGNEPKANLRGLKNKPGSTRPADITHLLHRRPPYESTLTITYALTQRKFLLVVNLVKQHPAEDLITKLKSGKTISKDQVIREMISKAQDSDIVTTSSKMSLKCPLSTLRIDVPCRSIRCTHNQCFDALSFLQLQEQAPTWTCPVCNQIVPFDLLEVDQYVNDILQKTPRSVDQVTIEPNGHWSLVTMDGASQTPGDRSDSDDEDLVEIKDRPRVAAMKNENILTPTSMTRTPPASSREQSTTSTTGLSATSKRPIGQVVDLTLSSDEDEEPPRAPKRQTPQISPRVIPGFQSMFGSENLPPRPGLMGFSLPQNPTSNGLPTPQYSYPAYGNRQ